MYGKGKQYERYGKLKLSLLCSKTPEICTLTMPAIFSSLHQVQCNLIELVWAKLGCIAFYVLEKVYVALFSEICSGGTFL